MNMKYYNASNHFSAPLPRESHPAPYYGRKEVVVPIRPPRPIAPPPQKVACQKQEPPPHKPKASRSPLPLSALKNLDLAHLKTDDLLLLGVIALLIFNHCDDTMLLLALGYLFFAGL